MVRIGNHLKMTVPHHLRSRTRDFYSGLLRCQPLASPRDDLDLYEFEGGFVLGLFFADIADTLSEADCLKATWLELKVADPPAWKARLQAFGVDLVQRYYAVEFASASIRAGSAYTGACLRTATLVDI